MSERREFLRKIWDKIAIFIQNVLKCMQTFYRSWNANARKDVRIKLKFLSLKQIWRPGLFRLRIRSENQGDAADRIEEMF